MTWSVDFYAEKGRHRGLIIDLLDRQMSILYVRQHNVKPD